MPALPPSAVVSPTDAGAPQRATLVRGVPRGACCLGWPRSHARRGSRALQGAARAHGYGEEAQAQQCDGGGFRHGREVVVGQSEC